MLLTLDKKILGKLQRFCVYRERSTKEVKDKLVALKVEYSALSAYINALEEQKFLSDTRFVSAYINDKFKINRWGKIKIRQALQLHQIDNSLIESGFEKIDDAEYAKTLRHIINRFKPKVKGLDVYAAQQKTLAHCYSKGFEPELVRTLLQVRD
jgi:regulatory protein